jgi:mannose/fructose/N-acetylgalactosamine-specific phosphotransferase system component IIB
VSKPLSKEDLLKLGFKPGICRLGDEEVTIYTKISLTEEDFKAYLTALSVEDLKVYSETLPTHQKRLITNLINSKIE